MSTMHKIFLCSIGVIVLVFVHGQVNELLNPSCLNCICDASSSCNASIGCFQPSTESRFCGPFGISFHYWVDAGKPIIRDDDPEGDTAFETCVQDIYCAAQTVQGYMEKFFESGDCNEDGKVDCIDFALIHNMGGFSCSKPGENDTIFFQNFQTCWNEIQSSATTQNTPTTISIRASTLPPSATSSPPVTASAP